MRWSWRPSEDREGRTTSRRRATSRCLRCSIQPASCMPRCSLLSGSASPRWPSAGRASPFSRPSCSTCCAGDAPCRQPRPLASLAFVPRATPAPLSRTSSSSAASFATSRTDTLTSTRRSWKTSSTAARSHRRMAMVRSALMPFWPRRLARLNLAAASVHDEHLTVHVASRVGGQEENRRGDLAGYADPAHRVLRQDTVEDLLVAPQRFGESSFDQAWRDRVDAHLGLLAEPLQVVAAAGVGGDRHGLIRVQGVASLCFSVEVRLLAAREDDLGSMLGEDLGDRASDATAGSGHQRDTP